MAIVISAFSVVVQVRTLDAFWPGGEPAFCAAAPNRTYRCDGQMAAVAFMAPAGAGAWVERALQPHGLRYEHAGRAIDLVVVDQTSGPLIPCRWIEFRRASSWGEACLVGAPDVPLAGPEGWAPPIVPPIASSPVLSPQVLEAWFLLCIAAAAWTRRRSSATSAGVFVTNVSVSPVVVLAVDTWVPGTSMGHSATQLPEGPWFFAGVGGDCA